MKGAQLAPGWPADDRPGQSLDRQWRSSSHDERREMLDQRPRSGRNDEEPEE